MFHKKIRKIVTIEGMMCNHCKNKVESSLKDKEKILTKKVLKKEVNDSTMVVEVFVVVLENIAQTQEFTKGE